MWLKDFDIACDGWYWDERDGSPQSGRIEQFTDQVRRWCERRPTEPCSGGILLS